MVFGCNNLYKQPGKVICIQAFADFKATDANYVFNYLNKHYQNVVLCNPISLPKHAYVKQRNRYRADTLIKYLQEFRSGDSISVGLTNYDISTTKNGYSDWGVMGLGYRPGRACVISTFRLKNKRDQLLKVVQHEIGHTFNLAHCKNKTCLMRDAEGGNPLDEEKDFCKKCKAHLNEKGLFTVGL
jgi:archaemetzincin